MEVRAIAAVALLTAGCMTKREGDTLAKDVRALDERMSRQLGGVETIADSARKTNAELGADVEALRAEVRSAKGETAARSADVEALRAQVTLLETRLAALEGRSTVAAKVANPDELWTNGELAFRADRYADALEQWKQLTQQFPGHPRADDAFYFRGETFMKQAQSEAAIREYQRVYERYADSSWADDALFRAAQAAFSLKNCTEARAYVGALKTKYPKSEKKIEAEDLDKSIKAAKATAKCTS